MTITAEEMRKELGIDNNISIKNILIDYFDEITNTYRDKKENIYIRIQYGIIDMRVEKILNKYGITKDLIDSEILEDEVKKFIKYLESLGYIAKYKKIYTDDFSISVSWINNFTSAESNLIPIFMINKDKEIEYSEDDKNEKSE